MQLGLSVHFLKFLGLQYIVLHGKDNWGERSEPHIDDTSAIFSICIYGTTDRSF